jgi:predicted Rdx family selenoprotein
MSAAAILLVAIVAEDPAVLRNSPRDDAPAQAQLWRGDWLEVRGETAGFLKVWDHRHERPGFIRPQIVRVERLDEASAPELKAVVRFVRDAVGYESLGIGYAALYLRAAPAGADTSEVFAAIGSMADRLARRASGRHMTARDTALAGHLEVAASYGVRFNTVDGDLTENTGRLCYDGEAWERVLATPGAPAVEKARAALFLASTRCQPALLPPAQQRQLNDRRLQALEELDPAALTPSLGGRVRLAHAEALAWRAYDEARHSGADALEKAARSEAAAVRELALTDRGVLAPEDLARYDETAIRVAASRWATEPATHDTRKRAVAVTTQPRMAGETCVRIVAASSGGSPANDNARPLAERCTYGVVWTSALRWSTSGTIATLVVQPMPAWTELWVLRRGTDPAGTWTIDTLSPATTEPEVGYVESAGFSPDGTKLLVVREARVSGRPTRKFQVLATSSLGIQLQASDVTRLSAFKRWQAAWWKAGTLALR